MEAYVVMTRTLDYYISPTVTENRLGNSNASNR